MDIYKEILMVILTKKHITGNFFEKKVKRNDKIKNNINRGRLFF